MDIDTNTIFTIESSNNPHAHNKRTNARGLGQITPVVLQEFNQMNKANIGPEDLFDPVVNGKISNWYVNVRIPQLLKSVGAPDTTENRLISYNFGIGNLKKHLNGQVGLPKETQDYILKYHLGGDIKVGQQRLKELGFDPGPTDGLLGPRTIKAFQEFQRSSVQPNLVERRYGIQSLKR